MPTRHTYVVLTNAIANTDEEFNQWYDDIHLDDVLRVPGVIAAQRFRATDGSTEPVTYQYCALYEIESDNPVAVLEELKRRAGSDNMPLSPAMSPDILDCLFTPLGNRRQRHII